MLKNPKYAREWKEKKAWYVEQGLIPGGGPHEVLLGTDDLHGVKEDEWEAEFNQYPTAADHPEATPVAAGPRSEGAIRSGVQGPVRGPCFEPRP
ncbi:hypothetical protein [Streptomyces sp. DB-54]